MSILSAGQQTALESPVIRTVYYVRFDFLSDSLYLTSNNQDDIWGGATWIGLGSLGSVSTIEQSGDMEAHRVSFRLNLAQPDYLALAILDTNEYRGRDATMYFCPLDESFLKVGTPAQFWSGIMDTMVVGIGNDGAGQVILNCETAAYGLKRNPTLRLNAGQQKEKYPTDTGLDYLTDIIAQPPIWLTKRFVQSIN